MELLFCVGQYFFKCTYTSLLQPLRLYTVSSFISRRTQNGNKCKKKYNISVLSSVNLYIKVEVFILLEFGFSHYIQSGLEGFKQTLIHTGSKYFASNNSAKAESKLRVYRLVCFTDIESAVNALPEQYGCRAAANIKALRVSVCERNDLTLPVPLELPFERRRPTLVSCSPTITRTRTTTKKDK